MTHEPFGFAVTRVSDGSVLFNSTPSVGRENDALSGLQFKEQFIEISTQLPSVLSETSLYGLGDSHKSAGESNL